MRCQVGCAIGVIVLFAFTTPASADDAAVRLQQGIYQEETIGDLEAASKIYQQIIADAETNRQHVAQAQYQLGVCCQKQGQRKEAAEAFAQVIRHFPDQTKFATAARLGLDRLGRSASAVVVRQVWAPAADASGSVSADGRHLSYVDWETGDLAIREIATGQTRRLTNKGTWSESSEYALHSVFSPDGKRIAYEWWNNKGDRLELRVVGIEGDAPRVLIDGRDLAWISVYDWSRDGKLILAALQRNDLTNQIALISPGDGSSKIVKLFDAPRLPRNPRVSPDGRYIAYSMESDDGKTADIFLLAIGGDHETALASHSSRDIVLGWTPSGDRLLFASDRGGSVDAWAIPVSDGKSVGSAQLVKVDLGQVRPITITRDGSFYYGVSIGGFEVYVATIDPDTGRILVPPKRASTRFAGTNVAPLWSRDGRTLAFSSVHRRGVVGRVLCFLSPESGQQREFPMKRKLLSNFHAMTWSPDNQSVLARNMDAEDYQRGLFQIDAQTGRVAVLVHSDGGATYTNPQWSPDGKVVFYLRVEANWEKTRIVRYDVVTAEYQELFPNEKPILFSLSPDAQQVAFVTEDEESKSLHIKRIPVAGGDAREVYRLQQPSAEESDDRGQEPEEVSIDSLVWTPDGRQLLYLSGSGDADLWQLSAEGGKPQKLELDMPRMRNLSIHPDGRQIAFQSGKAATSEIWVMQDFLSPLKTTE